jgi:hypothetical protein
MSISRYRKIGKFLYTLLIEVMQYTTLDCDQKERIIIREATREMTGM